MITYGHEKYIKQAIEGILMQECDFNVELIIADDKSPDKTETIVNNFLKNHSRKDWINYTKHKQNKGANSNFDWAMQQARGEYVALCEGDDYWVDPYKLQKQVDFLDIYSEYNICVHNTSILNGNELILKEWRLDNSRTEFNIHDYIYSIFFHTSSALFRNISASSYYLHGPEMLQGDIALFLSVINDKKVHFIDEYMGVYRLHENGITNDPFYKSRLNTYVSLLNIFSAFDNYSNYKFQVSVWLKKQTIKPLIRIYSAKHNKLMYSLYKGYYYLAKIFLRLKVWFSNLSLR